MADLLDLRSNDTEETSSKLIQIQNIKALFCTGRFSNFSQEYLQYQFLIKLKKKLY